MHRWKAVAAVVLLCGSATACGGADPSRPSAVAPAGNTPSSTDDCPPTAPPIPEIPDDGRRSAPPAGGGATRGAIPGGAGSPSGCPGASGGGAGVVDEPPGMIACARLADAIEDGSLLAPGVVDGILAAGGTADAPVADSADRLKRAYDAALAVSGKADEPEAVATVGAAASEMSDVCADSGLRTAG